MKGILVIIIFSILMIRCQDEPKRFVIDGKIEGIRDSAKVVLYDIDQQIVIDSNFVQDERFTLEGSVNNPTTCWLRTEGEYAIIEVENVKMTFNSILEDMHLNCNIEGGREQELRNELQALQKPYDIPYNAALDSLMNEKYADEDHKNRLIDIYNLNQTKSQTIYVNYGMHHPNSYLGLDIIYRNRKSISRDSIEVTYNNLTPKYKGTSIANAIEIFLYDEVIEMGAPFIDFQATTVDGKAFRLSSRKGDYIYLTFWSRGCGPCRLENRFISKNYERIPDNLSIVSFSIDRKITDWKKASKADNILWDNISDFEGGRGKVKTQYEVQAIPVSYLIDKEGIVRKRFTGFDPDDDIIDKLKTIIHEMETPTNTAR